MCHSYLGFCSRSGVQFRSLRVLFVAATTIDAHLAVTATADRRPRLARQWLCQTAPIWP
ncbi:hypothetical protein C2E23DRAFT_799369 [Lenzites betulinus]|nr:hypothetical protein C2E23DRAFT_844590 [Lenzites betulinus]KAH9848362.1 hypothetical protein C2E23DRAFT_844591 [Lenzites betulinus]KAH9853676.1 hypothetical protein C2E23DRAFT_822219 [Lenzites betulinus]KAH9853677.1 hypothetical protein C2E23DRAFT_822220 [Lenzites betulinus]KAH9858623.1 hypothetical protein C2E23DRAFT_799369 [Lenzites betulinus]